MTDEDRYGYNLYEYFDNISYNIIKYLMNNNELIWKLLKYKDRDAWKKSNLTFQEKGELIYAGQDDSTNFYVFMDEGNPDVHTREDTIIRVSPVMVYPENRTVGTVSVSLEAYSHYKVNTLSNYTTRIDVISSEFLRTLNGVNIDGLVGKLFFNMLQSQQVKLSTSGQLPFKGKQVILSSKSG